ncbi:Uncharacterized transporter [Morus notabilis]|uniref:Uncharacterized transporter n=1 Tax=Morus notabilis TaxID=981085 RepID=W9RKN6_9ROSA|nr:protein PIN-LIKES 3 [Morus notabilis]EXB95102.1 Uncharacterized transporter [Morus notabilis]
MAGGLIDLFLVASIPVLKLLILTALGSFLAFTASDILGDNARKRLNSLVFFVFNPAFVSSNLAKTITLERIISLWFMPVNIMSTFVIGSGLGWLVVKITKPPQHLKGLVLGCCSAGNLGNLPIVIILAVCRERGSPFGAPHLCHSSGMTYASLSMAIGAISLWSYVYNIVRISSSMGNADDPKRGTRPTKGTSDLVDGNFSNSEALVLGKDNSVSADHACHAKYKGESKVPICNQIKHYLTTLSSDINLRALFAPSTVGAVVGFIVGMVPQTRKLIVDDGAPLLVLYDAASLVSDAAIPTVALIMGANLLKGLKRSGSLARVICGIIGVRYVVQPAIGVAIVTAAKHYGALQLRLKDPLYEFVLHLQYALPPAMNIGTITQLFGAGESECSVIMLWTYAFASLSLTLWSTFFMWLVT